MRSGRSPYTPKPGFGIDTEEVVEARGERLARYVMRKAPGRRRRLTACGILGDMPTLDDTYLRLRPDSSVEALPADGFWPRLMSGQLGDFHHEYLVTQLRFTESWAGWEKHPLGDEVVCLLSGRITLIQEHDGVEVRTELTRSGEFAVNPRGTWHTADVHEESLVLFITAGEGTETRPR